MPLARLEALLGGDEDAIALALLDHLGVAGHHHDPGRARGGGHRVDDAARDYQL